MTTNTILNAGLIICQKEEEIKKICYTIQVNNKIVTLIKTWISGLLTSEIVLNEAGCNITTPLILQNLNQIIK